MDLDSTMKASERLWLPIMLTDEVSFGTICEDGKLSAWLPWHSAFSMSPTSKKMHSSLDLHVLNMISMPIFPC